MSEENIITSIPIGKFELIEPSTEEKVMDAATTLAMILGTGAVVARGVYWLAEKIAKTMDK